MSPEPPRTQAQPGGTRDDRFPRSRRSWGGIAALAAIALAVATWAVAASPLFQVRDVQVRGNRHLSDSDVVRLAGIRAGANVLTVSIRRVEGALAGSPWIRSAEVRRSLPSTLVLRIEERSPVAWVRQPNGIALVAADGTILALRDKAPSRLVSIGSWKEPLQPGDRLDGLREPLALAASLSQRLRREVVSASVRRGELVLRLGTGTRVLYGEAASLAQKNAALAKVLRWAGEQGAVLDYVDLRAPRNPAVRMAGA